VWGYMYVRMYLVVLWPEGQAIVMQKSIPYIGPLRVLYAKQIKQYKAVIISGLCDKSGLSCWSCMVMMFGGDDAHG